MYALGNLYQVYLQIKYRNSQIQPQFTAINLLLMTFVLAKGEELFDPLWQNLIL